MERKEIIQIAFLIVLVIAIGSLIYASITIVKYSDMLKNPLGYNLKQNGLVSCTCFDKHNAKIIINSLDYNSTQTYPITSQPIPYKNPIDYGDSK